MRIALHRARSAVPVSKGRLRQLLRCGVCACKQTYVRRNLRSCARCACHDRSDRVQRAPGACAESATQAHFARCLRHRQQRPTLQAAHPGGRVHHHARHGRRHVRGCAAAASAITLPLAVLDRSALTSPLLPLFACNASLVCIPWVCAGHISIALYITAILQSICRIFPIAASAPCRRRATIRPRGCRRHERGRDRADGRPAGHHLIPQGVRAPRDAAPQVTRRLPHRLPLPRRCGPYATCCALPCRRLRITFAHFFVLSSVAAQAP